MPHRIAHGVAGMVAVLGAVLAAVCLRGTIGSGWGASDFVASYTLGNLLIGASLTTAGTVLAWHRPRLVIGWLFAAGGLAYLISAAGAGLVPVGGAALSWYSPLAGAAFQAAWTFAIGIALPLALLAFPDGRLRGRPRIVHAALIVLSGGLFMVAYGSYPGDGFPSAVALRPELYAALQPLWDAAGVLNFVAWLSILTVMVVRFVRGDESARRRILWVALAAIVATVVTVPVTLFGWGEVGLLAAYVSIPAAVLVAVLRYQLLDIRLVVARSLVWAVLAAIVVGLDLALVALLAPLLSRGPSWVATALAAVAVAVAVEPLRRLLQHGVDRLLFGRRSGAHLARLLRERLAGGSEADELVDGLRRELGVPGLAFEITGQGVAAESGELGERSERMPLLMHGAEIGALRIGIRRGDAALRRGDRELLALIEPALAALAASMRLTAELAASRTELVEATERERVRLQRELHDGVASALTGVQFKIDAAQTLGDADRDVQAALASASADLRRTLHALREVIDDLRPPELARLGLAGALRERWSGAIGRTRAPVEVSVHGTGGSRLPAAAELAAYRIAVEAVTNALRHSGARSVRVELRRDVDALTVTVRDDGGNDPDWSEGTGLRSMRERVELLGGAFTAGPTEGGGLVRARMPVSHDAAAADA